MRYIAVIDGSPGACGVAFPDLPGCTAMGETIDQAMAQAGDALSDWMRTVGYGNAPAPRTAGELKDDPDVAPALASGGALAAIAVVRATGKPVRANLTLDEGVVSAIDIAARRRGVTRSAMVEIIARQQLPELA